NLGKTWARNYTKKLPNNPSFDDFITEIRQDFSPVNEAAEARNTIENLKQDKTVPHYVTMFKQLTNQTGYRDQELQQKFIKGLKTKIASHLLFSGNPPTTIDDWYTRATKYKNNLSLTDALMSKLKSLSTMN